MTVVLAHLALRCSPCFVKVDQRVRVEVALRHHVISFVWTIDFNNLSGCFKCLRLLNIDYLLFLLIVGSDHRILVQAAIYLCQVSLCH